MPMPNYNYGPASSNPFGYPTMGDPRDSEYQQALQDAQRREDQAQQRLRDFQALQISAAHQAAQNAQQAIFNQLSTLQARSQAAQSMQGLAATKYGLGQDQASNTLRIEQMGGDIAQQQDRQARDLAELRLRGAENDTRMQQDRYSRSRNQVDGGFSTIQRRYGY
jgi:hypothetical protein